MSTKRSSTSKSSALKRKISQVDTAQLRIENFFSSSPPLRFGNAQSKDSTQVPDKRNRKVKDSSKAPNIMDHQKHIAQQPESNRDLTLYRRLQTEKNQSGTSSAGPSKIIDVDLLFPDGGGLPQSGLEEPISESLSSPSPSYVSASNSTVQPNADHQQMPRLATVVADPPQYLDLSVDPLIFSINIEPWARGTDAPYSFLTHALTTVKETSSRILIINILTNAIRTISKYDPSSLLPALYLLSNCLSPPYIPVELGLGPSMISRAIQQVSGLTSASLRRLYHTTGDVGDVAYEAKSNLRTLIPHPPLRITAVHRSLLEIAKSKGQGSAKHKQAIVEKLLVASKGEETRFLVRTLSQNLRVGAVRTSILIALGKAMVLTPPSNSPTTIAQGSAYHATPTLLARLQSADVDPRRKAIDPIRDDINAMFNRAESLIKKVFVQHPNYNHIITAIFAAGLDGLAELVRLTVGIPLHPTLGSPTRSLDEVYERLHGMPFSAEFKYDGQRAQIHAHKTHDSVVSVQIFSRHLEDMTSKYPDVVELVQVLFQSSPSIQSFIMDSEIVAIDPADGSLKSFQELSNRARKDVDIHNVSVSVGVYAFDLMFLDGQVLIEQPFRERRNLLRTRLLPFIPSQKSMARFNHVESCESESGKEAIQEFWERAVESRCEGLMIKLLDTGEILEEGISRKANGRRKPLPATYEPDKRTSAWLKLKKDYVVGLGDSLDLVPIGAWHGNGRKAQWWSPILLAVQDPLTGRFVATCKCMSGFTDTFYKALNERYPQDSETCSRQPLWECDTGGLRPQVYFKPSEVWEIRGADVTLSPVSVAALGLVSDSRGLSLRFPRFIRVRDDKGLEETSTTGFLAGIYQSQQSSGRDQAGADDGDLVDEIVEDVGSEDEDYVG